MFVEVPDDVGSDDEAHQRFLDEQAALYKKRFLKKRKRKGTSSPPEADEQDDGFEDGDGEAAAAAFNANDEDEDNGDDAEAAGDDDNDDNNDDDDGDDDGDEDNVDDDEGEAGGNDDADEDGPRAAESDALKRQLLGARFRLLNEQLYSIPSTEAVELFQEHPELFEVYHAGFSEQVGKWPANPLDAMVQWLASKPTSLVVADFGCGDAQLAARAKQKTIHSFDLVAGNKRVTACDMAHDRTVDVAIFCLSLMGTNWEDFVREAHRVLRVGGTLLIAEVASRLADWAVFVRAVKTLGFDGTGLDKGAKNTHFVQLQFSKGGRAPSPKPTNVKLGVCKYKKR